MEFCESFEDDEFIEAVEDWIRSNPPYGPGYWFDAWSSYVISLRTVVWMQQLATRPHLPSSFVKSATRSIALQLRVLVDHLELDIGGNHLVKNAKALLWAGAFFKGPEADVWQQKGEWLLEKVLDQQILSDGMHFELSASYHAQVLADLLECAEALPRGEFRNQLLERFPRMAHALACLTHPDGDPALFNDAGLKMAYSANEIFGAAIPHIGSPPIVSGAFSLPAAGYYGFRQGQDYLLVKAGRIGADSLPAHAHADLLSFEWDLQGKRIVVDTGAGTYSPGSLRDYVRGTSSHNTVSLEDSNQAEVWEAFRVGRRTRATLNNLRLSDAGLDLKASHSGYQHLSGSPIHWRDVSAGAGKLDIVDRLQSTRGDAKGTARVQFHPDCQVERTTEGFRFAVGDVSGTILTPDSAGLRTSSWYPDIGVSHENQCLEVPVFEKSGETSLFFRSGSIAASRIGSSSGD